jgi:N-acylglucosamine 2-epimerase
MDALNIYMIDTNFCLEVKDAIPEVEIKQRVITNVETILNNFIDPQNGMLHEAVTPDFKNMDNHDGRLICPGHGIECTWFIMDTALLLNQTQWISPACDVLLKTLKYGWDEEFGGVLYFKDIKNKPLDRLDWDQKLWWVHNETLIALILAYKITKEPVYFEWFEKVHNYSWKTFADPEYGEWFGYINRQGRPLLTLKGGKWKGFFHVPRFLYLCHKILEQILEEEN